MTSQNNQTQPETTQRIRFLPEGETLRDHTDPRRYDGLVKAILLVCLLVVTAAALLTAVEHFR